MFVAVGERIPADGTVLKGVGTLDLSIVTGETSPENIEPGSRVLSGALNLSGPIELRIDRRPGDSFLADMVRLMEAAEGSRARYRRIADRAAALYSPVVHAVALATFAGWFLATGDWHRSLTLAIAVLIITCPCALGLAVPMVQAAAARRLFGIGVTMKDGSALERLAEIDHVVLDKTGTLTTGRMRVSSHDVPQAELPVAAALARLSRHPAAIAVAALGSGEGVEVSEAREIPGNGIEARIGACIWRLGRPGWAVEGDGERSGSGPWLSRDGIFVGRFDVSDTLREGAATAVAALKDSGLSVELLSGDAEEETRRVAKLTGIGQMSGRQRPEDKVSRLEDAPPRCDTGADGRRRHQRCACAWSGTRLDGSVDGSRCRTQRGRSRLPGFQPAQRAGGDIRGPEVHAPRPAEHRDLDRLQRAGTSLGHCRLRHAPRRCRGDVDLVDPGRGQLAAGAF